MSRDTLGTLRTQLAQWHAAFGQNLTHAIEDRRALVNALKDVMNAKSGMPKLCGHDYECICPWDRARTALVKESLRGGK